MSGIDNILKNLNKKADEKIVRKPEESLTNYIPGRFISDSLYYSEVIYDLGVKLGNTQLEIPEIADVIKIKENIDTSIPSDKVLYLDTESTGLNTGGASYAILVGLGAFENSKFVIRRWFLNSPDGEVRLLEEIKEFLRNFDLIVSYNGKSYDMNLLQSRYDYYQSGYMVKAFKQIDLLHIVRRFWKGKLMNCSLQTIESEILGFNRLPEDEIPGWKIPWAYFNYLETGFTEDIVKIHDHNATDILSMPIILSYLSNILVKDTEEHILPSSKYYETAGMHERATELLETIDENCSDCEALLHLASLYKKQRHWDKAVKLWSKPILTSNFKALEELAKYYEHKAKDIEKALQITQRAIDYLNLMPIAINKERELWSHRKKRLVNKCNKPTS